MTKFVMGKISPLKASIILKARLHIRERERGEEEKEKKRERRKEGEKERGRRKRRREKSESKAPANQLCALHLFLEMAYQDIIFSF